MKTSIWILSALVLCAFNHGAAQTVEEREWEWGYGRDAPGKCLIMRIMYIYLILLFTKLTSNKNMHYLDQFRLIPRESRAFLTSYTQINPPETMRGRVCLDAKSAQLWATFCDFAKIAIWGY